MFMPRAMASSTRARSTAESMPLEGAMPKMKQSGARPAGLRASARSRQTGMPLALVVEHHAGVATGLVAVDDRQDLVALGVADEAVGGLAVDLAEVGLAVDDGGRWSGGLDDRCGDVDR